VRLVRLVRPRALGLHVQLIFDAMSYSGTHSVQFATVIEVAFDVVHAHVRRLCGSAAPSFDPPQGTARKTRLRARHGARIGRRLDETA